MKAGVALAVMLVAGVGFADRYRIGVDTQLVKCLPGSTFYLIDQKDQKLERGQIYQFSAQGLEPVYDDGTAMVKILVGLPGDTVRIDEYRNIYVNGAYVGHGLTHAQRLHRPESAFIGETQLKPGEYWFMGSSHESFDSRYWGTVHEEQITARAYPIL